MWRPIFVFALLVLIPTSVLGTTYLIQPDGSGDFPTIQAAIDAANSGDIIELADGTFTGDGNRDIDYLGKSITVRSYGGLPDNCIIDCEGSAVNLHRAFYFHNQESNMSVVEGITITGGWRDNFPEYKGGGGIFCDGASPTITDCIFLNNHADRGGGIHCIFEGNPVVQDCQFIDNSATVEGGGISCGGCNDVRIINCTFIDNTAQLGAGVFLIQSHGEVDNCRFIGNFAFDGGGGLYRRSCGEEETITNCLFIMNRGEDGGGFASYTSGITNFYNCTFYGNVAATSKSYGEKGSAICCYYSSAAFLQNCLVAFSPAGEAVYSQYNNYVTIECCDFYGNVDGPGDVADQIGQNGNFSLDPLFCEPEVDDFSLQGNSPCASENNLQCGLIGALPVGCEYIPTTFIVSPDGSGDYPTIQAAINVAYHGDVIELLDGVFTGDGNRDIDYLGKAITVQSQGGDPEFCIIDCEGSQSDMHRGFIFQSQEDTNSVLQAVTITGGWRDDYPEFTGGGGINCEGASPKIDNCVFYANHADRGGAIRAWYESSPLILNCAFIQNSAGYAGGGVCASQTLAIKILNSTFIDNYSQLGGGVYLYSHEVEVDVQVDRCVFIGNETWDGGGALYRRSSWNELDVTNCVFSSNSAEDGGAFASYDSGLTRFLNCTFYGNIASTSKSYGDKGAAVCCYLSSTAYLENCIVAFSQAGEAVFSEPVNGVTIECCDFFGNVDGPGDVADQIGQNGNFSLDPLFCDPVGDDFHLHADSPCAPENSGGCDLIGSLDVGCGPDPLTLPYFEDFDDGMANDFTVVSGEWEVVDGEYRCLNEEPGAKHISIVGEWNWSDYRYEVDLATFGSEIQEVMVRYGPTGNWYVVTLSPFWNAAFLHKSYDGDVTLLLQVNDIPNQHEMWHHFTIDVQGATITVFFDDVELFSYTDTEDPLMTGKVGVVSFAWGAIDWQLAYFDNVSVMEIGGPETAVFEPLPALSDPISCDETTSLNFHYTPAVDTPAMKGYSVRVVAGTEVSFTDSDIFVNSLPPGDEVFYQFLENGVNDYTIDYTILGSGTGGITTEEDLFSIVFHGAAEGVANISITEADFRDLENLNIPVDYSAQASIPVDCGPPQKVTQITASPGHQYITVTWDEPNDPDLASVSVFRGLWHDGGGSSAYPLYGLLAGSTIPARPVSMQDAIDSDEWELAAFLDPGIGTIVDPLEPRGIYFYEVFAVDEVGNASLPADDNDRATNYWLGDIAPPGGDGYIDIADLSALGDTYGVGSGHEYFNPEADVGPTDDVSATGIPLPDGFIDFEDLMICGMNFGETGPGKVTEIKDQVVVLGWIKESELEWSCQLLEPCNSLKGLRISSVLPAGVTASVSEGELISQQAGPVFLRNVRLEGIDIGLAILGNGLGIQGTGELLRIYLTQEVDLLVAEFDARNVKNSELDIELRYEASDLIPDRFQLSQNYPNPFNPSTTIGFDLPEPQHVSMTIYSVDGRKIRALLSKPMDAGRHSIIWDGKDEQGLVVASGMYFYRIDAGPYQFTKKMALMK